MNSVASAIMKKIITDSVLFCLLLLIVCSCQRELSFENGQQAKGSLKADANGNCLPMKIAGTYLTTVSLGDTNYLELTVDVASPGNYSISTNTVNGFSFKGSGNFSAAGITTVKLSGLGKPATVGINNFTVQFDSSKCEIAVSTTSNNPPITPATFTLEGSPGNCLNAVLSGNFVKGVPLTDSSKIRIAVNAGTVGTYKISTDTVNGFYFSGSGSFTSTGVQNIFLTAKGSPVNTGVTNFKVFAGATSCTFPLTVTPAVPVTNNDYFPLTLNSNWLYDDLFNAGVTSKRIVTGQVNVNGNPYRSVTDQVMAASPDEHFYRKVDTNYYEYGSVDMYSKSVSFVPVIKGEVLFLKEGIKKGSTWSQEIIGPINGGQVIFFRYVFLCTEENATVTINGQSFLHVYKIRMTGQVKAEQANPYVNTGDLIDTYYAKGVGIIYEHALNGQFTYRQRQIKSWVVN